jgi:hypothetical protein
VELGSSGRHGEPRFSGAGGFGVCFHHNRVNDGNAGYVLAGSVLDGMRPAVLAPPGVSLAYCIMYANVVRCTTKWSIVGKFGTFYLHIARFMP